MTEKIGQAGAETGELTAMISGVKRMEIHDGDGLRTTVFFKGCPLRCVWCHNPESIAREPQLALFSEKCVKCGSCVSVCEKNAAMLGENSAKLDRAACDACFKCSKSCPTGALVSFGEKLTLDELYERVMADALFFKNSGGGVTLSGGECLSQPDFAAAFAKRLYESGVSVDVDTCGYAGRETFERVMPYVDVFLYDVKAVSPEVHLRCTGRDNSLILDNLSFLARSGCRLEIRYPLVKGRNDGECEAIAGLLEGLGEAVTGVKTLKYHDLAASRYAALGMKNTLPPPLTDDSDVEAARDVFRRHGLRVKE